MSLLTQRTAAVLQLAQIDATPCGKCSHPLLQHGVSLREPNYACRHYSWKKHASGDPTRTKQVHCRCKGFVDNAQLEIGVRA